MNAIIFGINGRDGQYLRELCKAGSVTVVGVFRPGGGNDEFMTTAVGVIKLVSECPIKYKEWI